MKDNSDDKDRALDGLFWKEEILQVLFWMEGEGLAKAVPFSKLLAMLNTNADNLLFHLIKSEEAGWIESKTENLDANCAVSLTDEGKKEAGRIFRNAFEGMQKAGHGECGPDCEFCYQDGEKLENCVHNCADSHSHPPGEK